MLKCLNVKMKEKGIAIYLAVIVMAIMLSIGVGLSTILVGQIRTLSRIGNSVTAFYAADTGIERELYETRITPGTRKDSGFSYDGFLDIDGDGITGDPGLGDTCPDTLQSNYPDDACYKVTINAISPYKVESVGFYKGVRRAIEVNFTVLPPITLDSASYATDWVRIFFIPQLSAASSTHDGDLRVSSELGGVTLESSLIKWEWFFTDIPADAVIESAIFHFYETYGPGGGGTISLMSVTDNSWTSGTSALTLYGWSTTGTIGLPYSDLFIGWKTVDITAQFEEAHATDQTLSLKWEQGSSDAIDSYASPSYSDPEKRPFIKVIFR